MIFIDSNVPMYLVGASHPHKVSAQRRLEQLVSDRERLVTSAEVLQEILHRYAAINRRDAIQAAFDALLGIVDEVLSIGADSVERAKTILMGQSALSARDCLHLSVMERNGIARILSYHADFDGYAGITRLS